ncbi:MAG TPA: hypothetical protein VK718_11375 [Ferruginibacter sp.]|nr:hypothetical protein [Ferruginibacter sp.]
MIISPHFPPSNLAAVHRSRLFAQHLPDFDWKPIVLMVDEKYYEEKLDHNLEKLLPQELQIEKTAAFKVTKPRLIGDIGLRGFFQLYKKAKQLIKQEKIDFLYIPIPSFYVALLGRWLHRTTGIKYGIDYIDPWVHHFPGSDKVFSRHWFSSKVAKFLEPIAIKKGSLITGVAAGYYQGVIKRNPYLLGNCIFGDMPYGGEKKDHEKLGQLDIAPYLFKKQAGKIQLIYAGAMLPKAYAPLENIFQSINDHPGIFSSLQIHFIGTGKTPDDANGYNIKALAEKYGLWQNIVFEYPKRIPYLDVLVHLNIVDGVFILGSTEPHYTPSKVYQGVLSGKPILAVLHKESTAVKVLKESGAGMVLDFDGEKEIDVIKNTFPTVMNEYLDWMKIFDPNKIDKKVFEQYSARSITQKLANLLNEAVNNNK